MDTSHKTEQSLAAYISITGAVILFLISLVAGIISDSVALLLDASMGLVILFAALFVRTIINKVDNPPDHLFNFGYEKYEPFTVVLQNAAIIITCLIGIKFAVQDIVHPDDVERYNISVLATFASCVIALLLGLYVRRAARVAGSHMLKTSAMHWFIDSAMSLGMCVGFSIGLLLRNFGYSNLSPYVDPVMAILLALIFMKLPVAGIAENLAELLDAVPPKDIQDRVKKIVEEHKAKLLGIERMRFRKAGRKVFLDVCFLVHGDLPVKEAKMLADSFERDMAREFSVLDCIVSFKHA